MEIKFDGIRERLERAKQNILNLDGEIQRFLDTSEYPILPDNDKELLLKAIAYHRGRAIPLRFSVLAGEIIHHLRSCLDHIAWQFSRDSYRLTKPTQIDFPILEVRPVNKTGATGYERQVKGIANAGALILIELLQPYNATDPLDSALLIIHKMDIVDKHRELVMCVSTGAFKMPFGVLDRFVRYKRGDPDAEPVDIGAEFKHHGQTVPQVSFKDFGRRELEPVVQGVTELHNAVVRIVNRFDALARFEEL